MKLSIGEFVDKVVLRQFGVAGCRQGAICGDGYARGIDEAHITRDDDALAWKCPDANHSSLVDLGDFLVVGDKIREPRDVACRII